MTTIELTSENHDAVTTQDGVVVVAAWAPWCAPCRGFAPTFEKVASEHPDCVFAKLNTEAEKELRNRLGIQNIPTLIVYRDGIMLYREAGSPPASALKELIEQAKALDMDEVRERKSQEAASAPAAPANPPA